MPPDHAAAFLVASMRRPSSPEVSPMPPPTPPPLRVIAVPGLLVADDVAYQNGNRFRFVGRSKAPAKFDPAEAGPEDASDKPPKNADRAHKLLMLRYPPEPSEYPDDVEHRFVLRALKKGAVLPLDEHTAGRAGVESPKTTKPAEKARKDGEA
jgi:hypothetical protein